MERYKAEQARIAQETPLAKAALRALQTNFDKVAGLSPEAPPAV